MKKRMLFILMIIFIFTVSCNKEKEVVKMSTGSVGGAYYPIGSSISELLSDKMDDYIFNAYTGQASVSNIAMLKDETIDMAIVQSNVVEWAYNGRDMFENEDVKNIRGIASLYPEVIQIIVTKSSGINHIGDLKGKRVSLGFKDSGNYFDALNILKAYGITTDDFIPLYLSFSDAVEGIKNKTVDGVFITSGVPTASVSLIESMIDINLLDIEESVRDALVEMYPYYTKTAIPKESYGSLVDDLNTISTPALWVCSPLLEDDFVYEMTKIFWESNWEIKGVHPSLATLSIENYKLGMSIPMHPGAQRYYEEILD